MPEAGQDDALRAPDISVVVPVHNGARFLGEALASVTSQRSQDGAPFAIEIVVVDDGSTDDSAAIARSVPGVRCLQQPNAGAAAAKNTGIEAARGTFLTFLDADDRWSAGSLAARHALLLSSGADMVFGRMGVFYEQGVQPRGAAATATLRGLVAGAMLIRRERFREVGPFEPRFNAGEFLDWYSRAQAAGLRVSHLEAIVLERRIHENNSGRDAKRAQRGYAEVLRAALARRRAGGAGE